MSRLTDKRFAKSGFVNISGEERKKLYIPTLEEVYAKLAEYEDAEEQGRLIKLPCKVGNNLYMIIFNKIFEEKLDKIVISYEAEHYIFDEFSVGRDVFFTREEAEAALEKMKRENEK